MKRNFEYTVHIKGASEKNVYVDNDEFEITIEIMLLAIAERLERLVHVLEATP